MAEGQEAIGFHQWELQEIKSSASRFFRLKAKVQRLSSYMAVLFELSFEQSDRLSKEVWVGLE